MLFPQGFRRATMTNESPGSGSGWHVPSLIISIMAGLLLGFAAGAAADRLIAPALGLSGQFAVGLLSAIVVALVVGGLSYRGLTRR
jgi:hypothetical protein